MLFLLIYNVIAEFKCIKWVWVTWLQTIQSWSCWWKTDVDCVYLCNITNEWPPPLATQNIWAYTVRNINPFVSSITAATTRVRKRLCQHARSFRWKVNQTKEITSGLKKLFYGSTTIKQKCRHIETIKDVLAVNLWLL